MEVLKFADNLYSLLAKDSINDSDVLHFVKTLVHLSKEVNEGRFLTFGPIVKQWIGAYKPIFCNKKIDDSVMPCIRKSGKILTEVFLSLMQSFNRHEPNHSLEFYCQWKLIMSEVNAWKRAKYVCLYGQQFKSLIENLRTATNRCDQLAILGVLLLYTKNVSSDELSKLKENLNVYILDKLAVLKKTPKLVMNQHAFLHDIDSVGCCIISLKATKIICDDLSLEFNTSIYSLWIDFNMRENSITLVAVSPKENALTFVATLARPKLSERLAEDQELKIRGPWSIMKRGEATIQRRTKINVYLPIHDRNAVWKAKVKSLFDFVSDPSTFSQSDNESMIMDPRLAQFAVEVDDRRYGMASQDDGSFSSFSMPCSQILQKPITPIARMQLDVDDISLCGIDRTEAQATKTYAANISEIKRHKTDFDRLADLPIVQQSFGDSIDHPPCDSLDIPLGDAPDDGFNDHLSDRVSDHLNFSDHSSGISLGDDMSVVDYDEFENGVDENLQRFGASSQISFSSTNSYFSEVDERVKRFIEETPPASQEISGQQPPNQHCNGNVSLTGITHSIRNIIRSISPASVDEHFEDQTKPSPLKHSPSEKRNSFRLQPIPSKFFTSSPIRTEHTTKDIDDAVEVADETMRTSPAKLNSSKVNLSNEMLRNEKMDVKNVVSEPCNLPQSHESFEDEMNMGDYDNDHDDHRSHAPVSLKSNERDTELKIDIEGMVFDERGCVFENEDEVEDAFYVYIENNGLEYLKSEALKAASPAQRRRSEREFRAIRRMINGKFEDDTFSPNESIVCTSRGTTKRKSWNSSDESVCLDRNDISKESEQRHPLKKRKSTESWSGNGTNAGVPEKKAQVDNGKLNAVPCALTELAAVINYLKDFLETREICGFHRLELLQSIAKIQEANSMASNGKDILSTTVANIRTICHHAREYVSMILHETANNKAIEA